MDHSISFQRVVHLNSRGVFMRISAFFFLLLLAARLSVAAEIATNNIKVDQVGYLPNAPKIALIDSSGTGSPVQNFALKRTSDNAVVFEGKLSAAVHDPNSGDQVH